jgi:hypothetical protein
VLAAQLIERCPATDLFGKKGRAWLGVQPLPMDECLGVEQRLRELDRLGEDLREVEQALAQATIDDARLRVMLTITGVNATVAIGLLSAIGHVERFPNPEKLVSYFGLNPSVYQSGLTPAEHDHITKRGRSYARTMLVEAAWGATQAPGPLRAFFLRVRDLRGQQIAIVATARKLAAVVWYVRACQTVTSSITAPVIELMNSGDTSVPYYSARNPWISRTVMPRAYIAMILSSKPVKRRSCFGIRIGAKLPSRSHGISRCSGPSSVGTVLPLLPLRWLVASSGRTAPAR